MKKFTKVSVTVVAISSALILMGPLTAFAATSPTLGAAESFSVIAQTTITGTAINISGDVGMNESYTWITALSTAMVSPGTIYSTPAGTLSEGRGITTLLPAAVQQNLSTAYDFLATGGDNATCFKVNGDSGTDTGTIQLGGLSLVPRVYCTEGSYQITGELKLAGTTGTWVFKTATGLTTASGSSVTGGDPCNVWWRVGSSAAGLGVNSTFLGTIIAYTGITFGSGVTLNGRALAIGAAVTLASGATISGPTCATTAAAAASVGSLQDGTITVVKTVINDSGGTKVVTDFPLFVNGTANGHQPVISGETNTFHTNGLYPYTITETADPNYTSNFSGDCDSSGLLNLRPGEHAVCLITNNDKGVPLAVVPPLIDVVKTASPLSIPAGPGSVVYTYTLRNVGTVPVTNVTMVGDTCSPIIRNSGDTNNDNKLDVNETWVYTCTQRLTATHTNTVTATGWANGISAVDIASATVVVGAPIVPPLIHVVKVPSVFTLQAPGGAVTYTYTVTNPGTAPLSNVTITDNKCTGLPGRVVGHPGDLNKNDLLESNETWSFTCKTNLTQTTTNIGTASGEANGMTARDFAIATVVVAQPKLPNTGLPPRSGTIPWDIFLSAGILILVSTSLVMTPRKS